MIDEKIEQINNLRSWNDYVIFEGKQYGNKYAIYI